jgi:hypothetical protein
MTNEDANTLITEVQKTRPGIARLARLLSIAVRVDAALLRRMRLRLAPELDVGAEADLWFSPLVESRGSTGFVLEKEVAALLRQSLVSEPGLLEQVEQALREERGDLQPSILMEEQVTALALAGASVTEMEEALRPAVLAIVDEKRGTDVARWVMRALPRLPPEVLKTEAAMMLSLGASARLGDRPVLANADSETVLQSWMTWALPKERLAERVQIGVRWLKEGIEFLIPSNEAKTTLELPRTEPLWLSISWQSRGQTFAQTVHVKPGRIVPLPEDVSELTLRTLGGDGYQVEFLGPAADSDAEKPICFVIMGFGKKMDFETGRVLDLDQSYLQLIKPAAEAAGLKCIRADEIIHSGAIEVPTYEMLLKAEVVVADLSTSNRNAIYQLGVRHALRPYTTLIIAEEQMLKLPTFDLVHIVIRKYQHLGEKIAVNEAKRFTSELTKAINELLALSPELRTDSPVYRFIDRLTPPSIAAGATR